MAGEPLRLPGHRCSNARAGGVHSSSAEGDVPPLAVRQPDLSFSWEKKPAKPIASLVLHLDMHGLQGRDVIACAHTGSGKTAAYALPILQQLAQNPFGVYALVLTPTR